MKLNFQKNKCAPNMYSFNLQLTERIRSGVPKGRIGDKTTAKFMKSNFFLSHSVYITLFITPSPQKKKIRARFATEYTF